MDINMDGVNIFGRTHDLTGAGAWKDQPGLAPSCAWPRTQGPRGAKPRPDARQADSSTGRDQFSFAKRGCPLRSISKAGIDFIGQPPGAGDGRKQDDYTAAPLPPSPRMRLDRELGPTRARWKTLCWTSNWASSWPTDR